MPILARVFSDVYYDSIALMNLASHLRDCAEVIDAAAVMGTASNKALLATAELLTAELESGTDSDLLIAAKLQSDSAASTVSAEIENYLRNARRRPARKSGFQPRSLESALAASPGANLAVISVAGRFAFQIARRALQQGLHVMLFSDNVSLAEEIELKQMARAKGLLVMGPDCGTAIINGVPLGFANSVSRGCIGVVAASGTGLQEVSTIISNAGEGISHAFGTGGRDLNSEVGGDTFLTAMRALAQDAATRVIVLISKPTSAPIIHKINEVATTINKPMLSLFLGAEGMQAGMASTLEEAALLAVALARKEDMDEAMAHLEQREEKLRESATREAAKRDKQQQYVRGLFSGGTLALEAQLLLSEFLPDVHSNISSKKAAPLVDIHRSHGHTIVDLGADEFTVGRLHPMIDYSLRLQRLRQEARDPQTAVILLDVVLGYGAHPDPASELAPVIRENSQRVTVVCSVTGTDRDPQNRSEVARRLQDAGALVMPTNAAASQLAGFIAADLTSR